MTVTSVCHYYQFLKSRVKNYIIKLLYTLVVVSKQKHKPLSAPRTNMKSQRTVTMRGMLWSPSMPTCSTGREAWPCRLPSSWEAPEVEGKGPYLCGCQGFNQPHSTGGKSLTHLMTRRGAEECLFSNVWLAHTSPLSCYRVLMHSVPCNSEAKGSPFPTPASLSLELPKRESCRQTCAQVPSASTWAAPWLCLGQTHPSPALGTQGATACPLAPQNTRTGRDSHPTYRGKLGSLPTSAQAQVPHSTATSPCSAGEPHTSLGDQTSRFGCFGAGDAIALVWSLKFRAVRK